MTLGQKQELLSLMLSKLIAPIYMKWVIRSEWGIYGRTIGIRMAVIIL